MASRQTSSAKKEGARLARSAIGGLNDVQSPIDAIAFLKRDHEDVAEMLEEFEEAGEDEKQDIAADICNALTVHAQIEEEIFYPAAREVLEDDDLELVNEADVEHGVVKQLIAQIQALDGSDDHFEAMVTVLGEYVQHHVGEEENELFPRLQDTDLDLVALGQRLSERKAELVAE